MTTQPIRIHPAAGLRIVPVTTKIERAKLPRWYRWTAVSLSASSIGGLAIAALVR